MVSQSIMPGTYHQNGLFPSCLVLLPLNVYAIHLFQKQHTALISVESSTLIAIGRQFLPVKLLRSNLA
jgi:hypothetical protein